MDGADRPATRAADETPLAGLTTPFVLLEDRLTPGAPAWLYRDPVAIIRCDAVADVEAAIAAIEDGVAQGLHAAGFLAYELGYVLEPALAPLTPPGRDTPLLWFGLFEAPETLDARVLDAAFAAMGPPPPIEGLTAAQSRSEHVDKIGAILRLIRAGEVYQVNLTFPMTFDYSGPPLSLYGALRAGQPVAHGGVVSLGDRTILSVSPELFVAIEDGQAISRPMKGTAPRLADPEADARARDRLAHDPKQRAENLMIVDLIRNDLSRISAPGAVRTPALFHVETYPTFHTLTSTVTARVRPEVGLRERLAALFPCGSIVGAPKIRAAQIIRELEAAPRGVYTGAIGAIRPGGDTAFNVAIRTATIDARGRGSYGVGGGVVADSDPDAEYDEALLKGRVLAALATDYGLIETLRWSAGKGFVRLDGHLARLTNSARQLGFVLDRDAALEDLTRQARTWTGDRRVRLLLSRDGATAITAEAIAPASGHAVSVALSSARLDAGDPFLRHKTTRRALYDQAFAEAAAQGLDEALMLNREGLVADASRNSVFLQRDGGLVTPPVSAGALPGVLRRELIAVGRAVESDLRLEDLRDAERWFLGNSLHGLRPARLADGG